MAVFRLGPEVAMSAAPSVMQCALTLPKAILAASIKIRFRSLAVLAAVLLGRNLLSQTPSHSFSIGDDSFLLDGKPFLMRCGEIHAARIPKEYWRQRLKMCKAMGLNTVCAYLFWNLHEQEPGKFNWSDRADVAEFCRIAGEEGLWVILRPGPYACAEWEMGGTPWWLLKGEGVKLRSRDPRYLAAMQRYFQEVGRVLAPLQVTRGGPIIMVQVENEYGFYGKDREYMSAVRASLQSAGFDVPFFGCNPPGVIRNGFLPDLFQGVNFASNSARAFQKLREVQPKGPLFCSEFYPGWFDTWGQPHHSGKEDKYLGELKAMLDAGASFSIYMAHGGTSFGLWAGCDRPFKPDTSSYDYDAPISEAGWPTPKFHRTRELFSAHLLPGETIPELPATNDVVSFMPVTLSETAPIFENLPEAVTDMKPQTMEQYDQGYGCILYRTTIPEGASGPLRPNMLHDFGFVFLDGNRIGVIDRRHPERSVMIPARSTPARLDILVYPMGRINFGAEMADRKGMSGPVSLGSKVLETSWEIFRLPLDGKMLAGLKFAKAHSQLGIPAFWRGSFRLEKAGDTFLDLRSWGKGVVWVNGRCLGRFWNIGPTQTAYAPGCWLKQGDNEVVILDLLGPDKPVLSGLEKPILGELRPEKDFSKGRPRVKPMLEAVSPVYEGAFAQGSGTQEVMFPAAAEGRYFCLEALGSHDGGPVAAVSELELLGPGGKPLGHEGWTIAYADSEESSAEDGSAENVLDGQIADHWITASKNKPAPYPHILMVDLGRKSQVAGFRYVPRQSEGPGRIKEYRVFVGDQLLRKE